MKTNKEEPETPATQLAIDIKKLDHLKLIKKEIEQLLIIANRINANIEDLMLCNLVFGERRNNDSSK
jgi:hypothetical protein